MRLKGIIGDLPSDDLALSIELGATTMAAGMVSADGAVRAWGAARVPDSTDPEAIWLSLAALVDRIHAMADDRRVIGVGVGSTGHLDLDKGTVSPNNLRAWRSFPVVERLAEVAPKLPVCLAGVGTCAATGEHWRGAGRGVDGVLVLVVSNGVDGGLIQSGRLVPWPASDAGRVGHTVVDETGDECPHSGHSCVETIATGPGLLAWATRHGWVNPLDPTVAALAAQARLGDATAIDAFRRAGRALAAAVASVAAVSDVSMVIIGGEVGREADLFLPTLREAITSHTHFWVAQPLIVQPTALPVSGVLVGAAALVFDPDRYSAEGATATFRPHDA